MVMGDFRRRYDALQRRLQLHQQRLCAGDTLFFRLNLGDGKRRIGAGMNTDDILTFGVNED